ncbi:CDP-glycerol glycerophosphotransferase family protein [Vagococcus fessus]|uniref:CDP-glycerol--glycerophosphate glycerophosphotransferase n=1 Tax=Vagococcus fessus TaxID=120370 RepID=A0A430ABF9_9ENTE|nr:CDP-glycerol glycerophosphotransferase family protein [Vagococcus fessus]RSU04521.1 hypothetical protein CBF31_00435 [Vagococcus fessus]
MEISKFKTSLLSLVLPVKKKQVYCCSFSGRYYSDSPRKISEYIQEHYPEHTVVWGYHNGYQDNFPDHIEKVKIGSFKWVKAMLTSGYWVSNARLPLEMHKPHKTVYLQTWHGTPLKRLANDMEVVNIVNMDPETYISEFLEETSRWDYLISPNKYSTPIFESCFDYKAEILEYGYPRNDDLFLRNTPDEINRIKEELNIPQNKKVVLYAPTWRDTKNFRLPFSLYQMRQTLGEDYVLLTRFHYLVRDRVATGHYEEFCYDVSDYPETSDLYLISDVLITDYSSTMYDFSLLKRPIILFMDDLELYKNDLRGFYYDIEAKPLGQVVKEQEKLGDAILNSEKLLPNFLPNYEEFTSKYNGDSSKHIVEKVFK